MYRSVYRYQFQSKRFRYLPRSLDAVSAVKVFKEVEVQAMEKAKVKETSR